jgi:hypothetical protein
MKNLLSAAAVKEQEQEQEQEQAKEAAATLIANDTATILKTMLGYGMVGKAGRAGVKDSQEALLVALFSGTAGVGTHLSPTTIEKIAAEAAAAIKEIPTALSPQSIQTLHRNIASACNAYLDVWCIPATIKITAKKIEYITINKDAAKKAAVLHRFHTAMLALKKDNILLYDAIGFHEASIAKVVKAVKEEKVVTIAESKESEMKLLQETFAKIAAN